MAESTDLIEKIWWVVPPVVVLFGMPLFHIFHGTMVSGYPYASLNQYNYIYKYIIGYIIFSIPGKIIVLVMSISMCIGYYISRKKSLLLRMITPIITAVLGYFIFLSLLPMECW
ncbi:hypothetical protein DRO03_11430 [Methanosarcinales archaeon]|nr:MAG: hypothetical protein DRO03_11430 [Methanosarcinales archaeon]